MTRETHRRGTHRHRASAAGRWLAAAAAAAGITACGGDAADGRAAITFPPVDALPVSPALPDLLTHLDGRPVRRAADWSARRAELLALLGHYEYGFPPDAAGPTSATLERTDEGAFGGRGVLRELTLRYPPAGTPPIHLLVVTPVDRAAPPVLLGLNFFGNHAVVDDPEVRLAQGWVPARGAGVVDNRATEAARGTRTEQWPIDQALARGYAVATFYHGDVDPDRDDFDDGVHPFFRAAGAPAREPDGWGTLAAWAWGLSRAVDHLAVDPAVDGARVVVFGHSRNGKAALLAAARDERIAAVVSMQSGCGGAALSRRRKGETVGLVNWQFPHWFAVTFRAFGRDEDRLPLDQHFLIAAVAPRPVLVASARGDWWADPEGERQALLAAAPAYALLGVEAALGAGAEARLDAVTGGRLGYFVRRGEHHVGAAEWRAMMDFADRELPTDARSR